MTSTLPMDQIGPPPTIPPPNPSHVCTCHTAGCWNDGIGIELFLYWQDDGEGEPGSGEWVPVGGVECGPCGVDITDIVPIPARSVMP